MRPGKRIALCSALITAVTLVVAAITASAYHPPAVHAVAIRAAVMQTAMGVPAPVPDEHADVAAAKIHAQISLDVATTVYQVQPGDTLSKIAKKFYGHGRDWPVLYYSSHVKWADQIAAGQKLRIVPLPRRIPAPPRLLAPAAPRAPPAAVTAPVTAVVSHAAAPAPVQPAVSSGVYSFGALEALWISAGGPSWAAASAASVAECESGGNPDAYNPSGATGIWQILGAVVGGDLRNAFTNALNAVSKFKASGDTFAQWVCQP